MENRISFIPLAVVPGAPAHPIASPTKMRPETPIAPTLTTLVEATQSWRSTCTSMPTTSTSAPMRRRTWTYMKGGHSAWMAIGGPTKMHV